MPTQNGRCPTPVLGLNLAVDGQETSGGRKYVGRRLLLRLLYCTGQLSCVKTPSFRISLADFISCVLTRAMHVPR